MRWLIAVLCTLPFCFGQQFQFKEEQTRAPAGLEVPDPVQGLTVADLDGDGLCDIALIDQNGIWLLQRSFGVWIRSRIVPNSAAIGTSRHLRARDFDADGDLDLLMSPSPGWVDGHVVLENISPGNFDTHVTPLNFLVMRGCIWSDVDQDGDEDLIYSLFNASQATRKIQLVRHTPSGYVLDHPSIPPGTPADRWPVAGDFDGDSDVDIIGLAMTGPSVLLENQNNTFVDNSSQLAAHPDGIASGVAGDLDADGFDDIAVATMIGDVEVHWGSATGFTVQTIQGLADVWELRLVDLDNDGDDDLFGLAMRGFKTWRNSGGRQFVADPGVPVVDRCMAADFGDINGDGKLDLFVVFRSNEARIRVFFGDQYVEDSVAEQGLITPGTQPPIQMPHFADLDNDGRVDAMLQTSAGLDIHMARGHGLYTRIVGPPVMAPLGALDRSFSLDFEGDGDLDLVLDSSQVVRGFANDGTGVFTQVFSEAAQSTMTSDPLRIGDVDGDGDPDMVRIVGSGLELFRNTGGVFQRTPIPLPSPLQMTPFCIELADFDGDQVLDLATDAVFGTSFVFLRGDGAGGFATHPSFTAAASLGAINSMAAADIDDDGDTDLVMRSRLLTQSLRVMTNDGSGTFTDATAGLFPTLPGSNQGTTVLVEDFDDDGDPDVLALLNSADQNPRYLRNEGGTFFDATLSRWGTTPNLGFELWGAQAVDVDGDGDLDLAAGGTNSAKVIYNYTRHLVSRAPPFLGNTLQMDLFSGPGYGPAGFGLLVASTASQITPTQMPGVRGLVDIDLQFATVLGMNVLSQVGVSRIFVPMPTSPQLLGTEVFFQGLIVSNGSQPTGVTNTVREVILP